jgi:TonB-linked SusC/RagA family outer membrane protein
MKINEKIGGQPYTGIPPQLMRIMKLTTAIMLVFLMQVSALTKAQITLKEKGTSLQKILEAISKQSGYDLVYSDLDFKKAKPVTISLDNVSIENALKAAFNGQPLIYEVSDKTIMVKKKEDTSFLENIIARFQGIDVRGRVVDSLGNGLPGASIKVKNGKGATTSNASGDFNLQNIDESAVLIISYIGYQAKEISASANLGDVILTLSDSKLDEVQVIAYGTVQKKFSTSNIGTITAKEISDQPVTNPLLMLQGRVTGLFVNQQSGVTASAVDVNIQGLNSLRVNANGPLYVIDGVPYNPSFPGGSLMGAAVSTGTLGNPSAFNFINPADIESISILKDADATAVYGSRAANGAILITTKKGKAGKTRIDVNARNGWGQIDHKLKMMNTEQYLSMRKEAYTNAGRTIPTTPAQYANGNADLTVWDQNKYTDWQNELIGGTAHFTDIQASVSGGSENTQFLVGYNYNRQTTVYPDDKADVKGNIHFNINHNSKDNKFKYFLTGSYLQDKNELNNQDLTGVSITLAPNAIDLRKSDGSINFGAVPNRTGTYTLFNNPLIYTLENFIGNTTNLIANNTISYEIIPGLELKSSNGYNNLLGDEMTIVPSTIYTPTNPNKTKSAQYLTKSASTWIIEPQLNYSRESNYGNFEVLLGGTFQQTKNDALTQSGRGYANDAQLENLQSATTVTINNVYQTLYKYNAFFGRLNYRLMDKYILNLTARRDGSSRFGENRKFHNFYAVGAAWLFGDEYLIKASLPWLSSGKLRANYGITGNDQIGDYGYLSTVSQYVVDIPYQDVISSSPTMLSNPFLQWEQTRKLNLGLDLGALKNRIVLGLNWYRNRSSNQLIGTPLPITTGFPDIQQNFPATVQNTGIEAQLDAYVIKSNNFNWHSSINFTKSKNKLIEYQDLAISADANNYIIGQPINIRRVYKFAGVNPTTGIYEVYDSKGERTSNPDATIDKTVIIDPNPEWFGGFVNSFQYKGFELNMLFQYVKQKGTNFRFGNGNGTPPGFTSTNQPVGVTDHWQKAGDVKDIQMVSTDYGVVGTAFTAASNSDAAYSDASYLRLKNLRFSYSLPTQLVNRAKISSIRIYLQGQNLLTFTNYIGADPETRTVIKLPPLRVFTFGLQVGI